MELPKGFTKDEINEVINLWDKIYDEVGCGAFPLFTFDFEQVYEDDEYIDRYFHQDDVEFCITTDKAENAHYLSESLYLNKDDFSEPFLIGDLKEMVK